MTSTEALLAEPSERPAILLLAAVILLWGINWPVMKAGLNFIPPLWFGAARVLLGASCLFAVLGVLGQFKLPGRADLPVVLTVGCLQIGLFLGLVHVGLQHVDAGRSAILAYTTPLWVVPIAAVALGERPTGASIVALVLGAAGIAVLFNPRSFDFSDPPTVTGNLMLLAAAISSAVSIVHIRKHRWRMTPLQLMPWQLSLAGIGLAAAAVATEPLKSIDWSFELGLVLAYNSVFASALCFWAYVTVARTLPASTTALGLLGVPVIGVVSSSLLLGESISHITALGLSLITGSLAILSVKTSRTS